MSPIPTKLFSRSGNCDSGRVSLANCGIGTRRDLANRSQLWVGADFFGAASNVLGQNPNSDEPAPALKPDLEGKEYLRGEMRDLPWT